MGARERVCTEHIHDARRVRRIHTYSECSPTAVVMALVYIDRVQGRDFVVNSLNVHRLLVTRFGPSLLEHAWRAPRRARHALPPSRASAVTFEAAMAGLG